MNFDFKKLASAAGRHSTLLALVAATIYLTKLSADVTYQTALTIFSIEALNLWIFYIIIFALSPDNYLTRLTNALKETDNGRNVAIYAALVMGIFISVHVFSGLAVFGVYFTKYTPMP